MYGPNTTVDLNFGSYFVFGPGDPRMSDYSLFLLTFLHKSQIIKHLKGLRCY